MTRTRLIFENIQQIVGGDNLAVVLLTDEAKEYCLSVVCDKLQSDQILLRLRHPKLCASLLPESLVKMLPDMYEMTIYGLHQGQYQTVLSNSDFSRDASIRISDAVLLTLISDIPLYIEDSLWRSQRNKYDAFAPGVAIPINSMDRQRLSLALQKAIEDENYELASHLRDEIIRRNENKS